MSLYKTVTDLLKSHGYNLHRQGKGSHEIWCCDGKECTTVPVNLKSRHTANKILKDANIKQKL